MYVSGKRGLFFRVRTRKCQGYIFLCLVPVTFRTVLKRSNGDSAGEQSVACTPERQSSVEVSE